MAAEDSTDPTQKPKDTTQDEQERQNVGEDPRDSSSDSDSSSSSDSDSDSESESEDSKSAASGSGPAIDYVRPGQDPAADEDDNSREANIRRFMEVLHSKRAKRREAEEEENLVYHEDLFDFPKDPENWREEDIQEIWADAPLGYTKPGWDPEEADEEDWQVMKEEEEAGRKPPIAPFYVPYRKPFPAIPDNHYDISNPKAVIEELDRIEEFLRWVSYIFPDGSTYEGTVWDDLAHGRGVYVADYGLFRYEGEWLQNNMEGHGVIEIDVPDDEPVPGSKLEAQMRAEGRIISRDFLSPEDREWLEMDIEDSIRLAGGMNKTPWFESEEWVKAYGSKPERGRYRYAGQWKHDRMHGCGVYSVNERPIYGRFYFGELVDDEHDDCNEEASAMHAGIAEVAAAKARMFVNKPDGMVREKWGPYNDPQHPYFYEEDDVWMAPGFINQFYEVPDYWKTYVHEVDEEREMWLNGFYRSPLRLPMPAELEYLWEKAEPPEFVFINKEPEPDPEDPSNLIYTEPPLILHTRSGRIINYIEDEKYGLRLFWQPPLEEGEDVDPEKAVFLPLGYDEFFGEGVTETEEEPRLKRLIVAVENACKLVFDKIERWADDMKKDGEAKLKLIEENIELAEAELELEMERAALEAELDMIESMENAEIDLPKEESTSSSEMIERDTRSMSQEEKDEDEEKEKEEEEEEEEGEDEEDDSNAPSSFGSVGKSPFAASSLSLNSHSPVLTVPTRLRNSFLSWKVGEQSQKTPSYTLKHGNCSRAIESVSFPLASGHSRILRAARLQHKQLRTRNQGKTQLHSLSRMLLGSSFPAKPEGNKEKNCSWNLGHRHAMPERGLSNVLTLHIPLDELPGIIWERDTTIIQAAV